MSTSKKHEIIEEARRYVDAAHYYQSLGDYIRLVQQRGYSESAQTANTERRVEIRNKQLEDINKAIDEGQKRMTPPTIALNNLVKATDAPVYFEYDDQELRVVPKNDSAAPNDGFKVERKQGGSWTSV